MAGEGWLGVEGGEQSETQRSGKRLRLICRWTQRDLLVSRVCWTDTPSHFVSRDYSHSRVATQYLNPLLCCVNTNCFTIQTIVQEIIYFLDVKLTTFIPALTTQTSPCLFSSPSMTMDLGLVLLVVKIISINFHFTSNILEARIRDFWASVILVKEIVTRVYNSFHFQRRFLAFHLEFLISTWVCHYSLLLKQRSESPGNGF